MFNQKKYNKEHKREIKEYKRQWYLDNQKRLLEKEVMF